MQLYSKNRFIAAQFIAFLSNNLWLQLALHSNQMAQMMAEKLQTIPEIKITQPVQTNSIFVIIPEKIIEPLRKKYKFYTWNEQTNELRWMCSFDTIEKEIDDFVETIRQLVE